MQIYEIIWEIYKNWAVFLFISYLIDVHRHAVGYCHDYMQQVFCDLYEKRVNKKNRRAAH